jgi:hypothetical protein
MAMGERLDCRRTAAAGGARRFATLLLLAIPPVLGFGVPATAASLKFSFVAAGTLATLPATNPTLYANVTGGFAAAGAYWSSQFQDDITINIEIDYPALAPGTLGDASFQSVGIGYADVRSALTFDRRSVDDFTAASSLPAGTALSFLTNNEQTGALQVDANGTINNVVLDVPRANAKALGFYGTGFDPNDAVIDAAINFSSNYSWDFDRSNGISPGTIDFVGVAIHEIGHAMGFVSGVDVVDFVSFPNGNAAYRGTELDPYRVFSVLDLYRHGARNGGGLDYATGGTGANTPYFSLDGGLTSLGSFATGQLNGDGRQASHWKDNLGLGIMDPTFAYGELGVVKPLDIRAFDVIGYDLVVVPEPATLALLAPAVVIALCRSRRRRG